MFLKEKADDASDSDVGSLSRGAFQSVLTRQVLWIAIGVAFLVFDLVVAIGWIFGGGLKSVTVDADTVPTRIKVAAWAFQALVLCLVGVLAARGVRAWRRTRELSLEAATGLGLITVAFQDVLCNYSGVPNSQYNPYYLNVASWGPWIPGWNSSHPVGTQPEPLIVVGLGYLMVLPVAWCIIGFMKSLKKYRPGMGRVSNLALGFLFFIVLDVLLEVFLVWGTGAYIYPHGIRSLSVFSGHWYQLGLNTVAALAVLCVGTAQLLMSVEGNDSSFVERLPPDAASRFPAGARLLACVGYVNALMFVVVVIVGFTNGLWGGPAPADIPGYFPK